MNNSWERRAALLDRRLAQAHPLAEVTQNIALDAVSILSSELEALAAESRMRPGRQRLRDLTALLQVLSAMGGLDVAAKAGAQDAEELDYSQLDEADLAILAQAFSSDGQGPKETSMIPPSIDSIQQALAQDGRWRDLALSVLANEQLAKLPEEAYVAMIQELRIWILGLHAASKAGKLEEIRSDFGARPSGLIQSFPPSRHDLTSYRHEGDPHPTHARVSLTLI